VDYEPIGSMDVGRYASSSFQQSSSSPLVTCLDDRIGSDTATTIPPLSPLHLLASYASLPYFSKSYPSDKASSVEGCADAHQTMPHEPGHEPIFRCNP
jgi:hypothetical protein